MSKEEKILKNNEEILSEKELNEVGGGAGFRKDLAGGVAGGLAGGLADKARPVTEVFKEKVPSLSDPLSGGISGGKVSNPPKA